MARENEFMDLCIAQNTEEVVTRFLWENYRLL